MNTQADSRSASRAGAAARVQPDRPLALRRLLAFTVDWFVVAAWGGLLFGVVMLANGGHMPSPPGPWEAQAIGFLSMTLPVTLYFATTEGSGMQASLGKRVLGLVVCDDLGRQLAFRAALWRSACKFVPWEVGHLVAQQAACSGDAGLPPWVWIAVAIAFAGPVWWVAALMATGRTPYDRWSASHVERYRGSSVCNR